MPCYRDKRTFTTFIFRSLKILGVGPTGFSQQHETQQSNPFKDYACARKLTIRSVHFAMAALSAGYKQNILQSGGPSMSGHSIHSTPAKTASGYHRVLSRRLSPSERWASTSGLQSFAGDPSQHFQGWLGQFSSTRTTPFSACSRILT